MNAHFRAEGSNVPSHRSGIFFPRDVETDGRAREIRANQMPYLDNSPDR